MKKSFYFENFGKTKDIFLKQDKEKIYIYIYIYEEMITI